MHGTRFPTDGPGLTGLLMLALLILGLPLVVRSVQLDPDKASNPPSPQHVPGFDRGAPGQP